ncbi:unnamed protein product [Meganyctiphanes norvegica]|uniref:Carboxylesterase type B domain-containing protein n=1 Tax=Meganyctiphanes norvegica TaxID=48144 RepID=A0AAV2S560_MEGNR
MLLALYLLLSLGTAWSAAAAVSSNAEAFSWVGTRPAVDLPQGRVVGLNVHRQGYAYLGYRKIPFAEPPVGELRFKDPVPAGAWEGDLDGRWLPPFCDQLHYIGQEDCLFLNVYTPPDAANASSPLPVMFFIHGGGYTIGMETVFDGVNVMVEKDVIVVVIQYRLGIFGFLSTEDEVISGNQGFKDQVLALQWVHDNIHYFNGDPNRVTIYGESAGSSSVHFHVMSPYSAGLFQGAIMESGTAISPWALGRDFKRIATETAEKFECPTSTSEEMLICLQGVEHHHLCSIDNQVWIWNLQPFYFAPRIDGDYIPDHPVRLIKSGEYNHVPVIMGVNRNEGALESGEMFLIPRSIEDLMNNFTEYGPISLMLYEDEEPLDTTNKVYDFYLGGHDITEEKFYSLTDMFTHLLFAMPLDFTVQMMASQDPVYMYEFHHRGKNGYMTLLKDLGLNITEGQDCVSHGDDLLYVFDLLWEVGDHLTESDDLAVQEHFTTLWTNFAKTGNPTPDDSLSYTWPVTDAINRQHLRILPEPILKMDQREVFRAFWEDLPLRINRLMNE